MKEKILTQLKTKYKHLGLSENTFNGVSDLISKTIKEESEIEQAITNAESLLKEFQSEIDRRVGDLKKNNQELESQNKELLKKQNPSKKDDENNDIPDYVKKIQEKLDALTLKNEADDKAGKLSMLKSEAKKKMIAKGVNESLCDKLLAKVDVLDTDNDETIALKGIEEYNFFKSALTPEAGDLKSVQKEVTDDVLSEFFKKKKAEGEQAQKIIENAEKI